MIDAFFSTTEAKRCFKTFVHYNLYELNEKTLKRFKDHKRIRLFNFLGYKCNGCGVEGKYVVVGKMVYALSHDKTLIIYTEDFTELTLDHIIPKSKGGIGRENKQCLCWPCNQQKSDKVLGGA